jgi:hypothetical protein
MEDLMPAPEDHEKQKLRIKVLLAAVTGAAAGTAREAINWLLRRFVDS